MSISSYQQIRIDRIYNNNIFLLDITKNTFDYFIKICGTTKNVYTVKISHKGYNMGKIYCDCPDGKKFNKQYVFCKHSCFVILKILRTINLEYNLIASICNLLIFTDEQLKIIANELDKLNIDTQLLDNRLIDNSLLIKYNNYNGPIFDVKQYDKEESCIICFDNFGSIAVNICPTCSKIFHKGCITIWFNNSEQKTCPHCRSHIWNKFGSTFDYNNLA